MSSPAKRMVPAVGVSCSRISLDVVVLPHPDSPMRPKVSPGQIAKSTPSTALTQPILRRSSIPVLTGKCFSRACSSSNGADIFFLCLLIDEPASRRPIRSEAADLRLLYHAARHGVGATRVKGTAPWKLGKIGRLAWDRKERLLAAELWHGTEQSLGVGVLRSTEQVAYRTLFDNLSGIHDRHLVAHL